MHYVIGNTGGRKSCRPRLKFGTLVGGLGWLLLVVVLLKPAVLYWLQRTVWQLGQ